VKFRETLYDYELTLWVNFGVHPTQNGRIAAILH